MMCNVGSVYLCVMGGQDGNQYFVGYFFHGGLLEYFIININKYVTDTKYKG
jgi:hypothetical protein